MEKETKKALLDAILTRAAEQVGDITAPVMALFYSRFPEARPSFETLWPGKREELEGEMVERVLYCLMTWFDYPGEIEVMLIGSVPHHAQTLKVPPEWYGGLMNAASEVIGATIPSDEADEHAVWNELTGELADLIEQSGQYT